MKVNGEPMDEPKGEPRGESKGDHEKLSPFILLAGMGEPMRESRRER